MNATRLPFLLAASMSLWLVRPAAAQNDETRTIEFETSEVTAADVTVSPDGQRLIFTMLGHLFRLPVEGGIAEQLTFGPYYDTDPVFSPDGTRVAFVSDRDGSEGNIFVLDLATRQTAQVTQERWAVRPAWTPGGEGIVYLRVMREVPALQPIPRHSTPDILSAQVRRVSVSGGAPATLSAEPRVIGSVFYLPDGRLGWAVIELALGDDAAGAQGGQRSVRASTTIEILNRDGSVRRLPALDGYVAPVVPSPDGDGFYGRRFQPALPWHDGLTRSHWHRVSVTDDDLVFVSLTDGAEKTLTTLTRPRGWTPRFAAAADSSLYLGESGRLWKLAVPSGARELIEFRATVRLEIQDPVAPENGPVIAGGSAEPLILLEPRLSPDGRTLLFGAAGHLWRQSLDGGDAHRLFQGSAFERAPAFSPDGRQLAFVRTERGQEEIRIFDFESRAVRTVTSGLNYWGVRWSPDGQRLVYVESQQSRNRIVALDLSTGETKQVIDVRFRRVVRPHFSAEGQSIFFSDGDRGGDGTLSPEQLRQARFGVEDENRHQLYRLSLAANAEPMPVSPPELRLARALVSPDGRWIAFIRGRTRISIARVREGASVKAEDVQQLSPAWFDVGGLDTFTFTPDSSAVVYAVGSRLWRHPIGGGEREEIPIRLQLRGPTPPPLLLRRVRVLDFPSGGFGRETSVFIEGGRIRRIGAEVGSVPSGTFTIDGAGRFAIPGLFDMHVHASWMVGDDGGSWDREREFDPLQVFLAYGLTSVREPGGRLAFVNALADRTRMTSDPLPRFFSSGEIFEGTEQFTRFRVMGLPLRNEDEARTYARLWKGWGADFIKVYPSLSWPLQRAVNEEARRQGLSVVGHGSNGVEEMVKSVTLGYTSIEHCLLDRPYDDLLQLLASAGTRWVPTLSALGVGGFEVLSGEMQRLEDPKFRAFYPEAHKEVAGWVETRRAIGFTDEKWQRRWAGLRAGIRAGHERGVKLLAGTDSLPGPTLHWELERLVNAGIEPLEVLRIATEQAAEAVGARDDLGTLEAGKLADLVLLDANPLEDIKNTQAIWRVIKGGWLFDPEELRPAIGSSQQ